MTDRVSQSLKSMLDTLDEIAFRANLILSYLLSLQKNGAWIETAKSSAERN